MIKVLVENNTVVGFDVDDIDKIDDKIYMDAIFSLVGSEIEYIKELSTDDFNHIERNAK